MRKRLDVQIPEEGWAVWIACGLFGAAALIRLWYYLPMELDFFTELVHLWLPVTAAAVFLAGFFMGCGWAKPAAIAAVVIGVAFFFIKAENFEPLHRNLCRTLYLLVLILFTLTLTGRLPTKKLLYPLFSLPLAYHIVVEDTKAYFFAEPPVPVRQWMPELSVLCIMAALLSLSVSLKTKKV